jgi:mono/diheme cytochrome c family protein
MKRFAYTVLAFGLLALAGCSAGGDNPGREYAPNMYHSVAYEPLSQITDPDAGRWVTSTVYPDGHAEYYNTNILNVHKMNMREPAPHTVKRNAHGWLPYRVPKDSLAQANAYTNPLEESPALMASGKALFEIYCDHCHGAKGEGGETGKVGAVFAGVPAYKSDALINMTEGHIFHVITHGKGRMGAHGSQVSAEDRWKIAKYVKSLQK